MLPKPLGGLPLTAVSRKRRQLKRRSCPEAWDRAQRWGGTAEPRSSLPAHRDNMQATPQPQWCPQVGCTFVEGVRHPVPHRPAFLSSLPWKAPARNTWNALPAARLPFRVSEQVSEPVCALSRGACCEDLESDPRGGRHGLPKSAVNGDGVPGEGMQRLGSPSSTGHP